MAKADPRKLALQALSSALSDPAPKVLHGSSKKPGIFASAALAAKQAAQYCLDQGWLEATGQLEGKGKTRKELYRITPAGVRAVLDNSEPVTLLQESLGFLQRNAGELALLKTKVEQTLGSLHNHQDMLSRLLDRLKPPDLDSLLRGFSRDSASAPKAPAPPDRDWLKNSLEYLEDYQRRHPYGHCPLPELFHRVAEPTGLTIGQFHDGLRQLVKQGQVRLHAFTGAAYQLQEEQFALVAGQEIKYYAERLAGT